MKIPVIVVRVTMVVCAWGFLCRAMALASGGSQTTGAPAQNARTPALSQQSAAPTASDSINGDWSGTLESGDTKLRLVLHISRDKNGVLRATLDSSDQGVYGLEVSSIFREQATVSFEVAPVGASYQGKLSADRKYITGMWQQAGQGIALVFRREAPGAGSRVPVNAISPAEGTWQGAVEEEHLRHRLQLHISHDDKRQLVASLDSLDQGVSSLPAAKVTEQGGAVHLEIPVAGGIYDGKLNAARNEITGTWTQNGETHALNFKRSNQILEARRPQNPQKPYPYLEEDVTFDNAAARVKLAGTLTLPKGTGPFAAAVLISGSGPHDRDETIASHKPFWILADYLTRQGVAVLRYDKRGVGKSTGAEGEATTEDLASDAQAAIEFLRSRKEIEAKRIGLIGHSEGGMIAPMIAAQGVGVAWMVLLAAPTKTGEATLLEQSELIARAGGLNEAQINGSLDFDKRAYVVVREGTDRDAIEAKLGELVKTSNMAAFVPPEALAGQIHAMSSPWFRYFLTYDPLPTLKKVKCPVLALAGEKDLQVPPLDNLPALKKAIEDGGNKDVTATQLPELNHLFQHCNSGSPTEYGAIEETFSPEALQIISDWLKKRGA